MDPRVVFITTGGTAIGKDKIILAKTTCESGVRRTIEKTPEFDLRKEKKIFEEARREFGGDQASSSKAQP